MKSHFIFCLLVIIFLPGISFSQNSYKIRKDIPKHVSPKLHALQTNAINSFDIEKKEMKSRKIDDPNFVEIGNAPNAYNFSGNTRTILWTDEHSDAITLIHKLESPYTGYDVSFDRGQTWTTNIPLGDFVFPQGGIINLSNQSNVDDLFLTYVGVNYNENDSIQFNWGVHGLNQTQAPTDTVFYTGDEQTAAFAITQSGTVYYVIKSLDESFQYQDTLIIMKGNYDNENQLFNYNLTKLYVPIDHQMSAELVDVKIAFSPDGQTGYLAILSDNGSIPFSSGSFYPILYKTEDGGESWSGPEALQLGGPDGFYNVKGFLTNQQLEEFFEPPVPDRDSILFTAAYDIDITVDHNGNPHLIMVIGIGDGAYGIYTPPEYISAFTLGIYEKNGWMAWELSPLKTFRGIFGDITEDNRPQIARSFGGDMIYYSWLDTEFEGIEENELPDIFITSQIVGCLYLSPPYWTSVFTQGWLQSNFGGISEYIYDRDEQSVPVYYLTGKDAPINSSNPVEFIFVSNQMSGGPYPSLPEFEADTTRIEEGACVNFTLLSSPSSEITTWEFEGGNPSFYWGFQPPPIYYSSAGVYNVTVETSDMMGSCTTVLEDYITVLDPVKIEVPIESATISIIPNPASDYFIINLSPTMEGQLFIYDYSGRKKITEYIDNQSSVQIDVSCFLPGIYIITFRNVEGKLFAEKLVVE